MNLVLGKIYQIDFDDPEDPDASYHGLGVFVRLVQDASPEELCECVIPEEGVALFNVSNLSEPPELSRIP